MPKSLFGSVAVLLLVPMVATAGPISWSYNAEVSAIDGEYAYFGTEFKTTVDPTTGAEVRTPYLILGQVPRWNQGNGTGSQTVHVGSYGVSDLSAYSTNDQWAVTRPELFTLAFTLTDTKSQQTTTLNYSVDGTSNGFFQSGTGVVNISVENRTDTVVLGTNRYTIHPVVTSSESGESVDMEVTAVTATPEPTTLILAAVGLTAGWLLQFRRRFNLLAA